MGVRRGAKHSFGLHISPRPTWLPALIEPPGRCDGLGRRHHQRGNLWLDVGKWLRRKGDVRPTQEGGPLRLLGVGEGGRERQRWFGWRFGIASGERRRNGLRRHRPLEGKGIGDRPASTKSFIRELAIPCALIA